MTTLASGIQLSSCDEAGTSPYRGLLMGEESQCSDNSPGVVYSRATHVS